MFISLISFAASVLLILSIITVIAVAQCVASGRYEKAQLHNAIGHLVMPNVLVVVAHTGFPYEPICGMMVFTAILLLCAWATAFSGKDPQGSLGVLWLSFMTVAIIPVSMVTGFGGQVIPAFVFMVVMFYGAWFRYLNRLIKKDKERKNETPLL